MALRSSFSCFPKGYMENLQMPLLSFPTYYYSDWIKMIQFDVYAYISFAEDLHIAGVYKWNSSIFSNVNLEGVL